MKLLYKVSFFIFFIVMSFRDIYGQIVEGPPYGVIGVSFSCDGKTTRVFVETTRKPKGKVFYLSNPLRVVIDIENAILMMKTRAATKLPDGLFLDFVSSQYKGGKNPIVRIVFKTVSKIEDFKQAAVEEGFEILFSTPGYPVSSWASEKKEEGLQKPEKPAVAEPSSLAAITETLPVAAKPETILPPAGEVKPYKREMVSFVYEGKDPFLPQAPTKEVPFGSKVFANIEAISLVGIVVEGKERKALLEDKLGFGYLLGVGDSVENGIVKRVGERDVTFQIEEFGWTRTVTLELPKEAK